MIVRLIGLPVGIPSPTPTGNTFGSDVFHFSFLLTAMIWLPVIGAVLIAVLPSPAGRWDRQLRMTAMAVCGFLLFLAFIAYGQFAVAAGGLQFEENVPWLPGIGARYHLGVDGVGIVALLLNSLVGVVAVLASWQVRTRMREYFALLLLVQAAVNGVVCAHDLFVLVVFWGACTIPVALLVAGWGGPRRQQATNRLLVYWGLGSVALVIAVLFLYQATGWVSFDFDYVLKAQLDRRIQIAAGIAVLIAAGTRLPLFPLHGWARDLFAEAPAGVAVIVTGSVTRLGAYLMLRVLVGAMPDGAHALSSWLAAAAVATAVFSGVMALAQVRGDRDVRRLGAYLALLPGAVTALALAGLTPLSIEAAGFSLFAGGLAAALAVGACATLADRAQTRSLAVLNGIGLRSPSLAWLVALAGFAVLGIPGFATWTAHALTFLGTVRTLPLWTAATAAGLVLAAFAVAGLLYRAVYGPPNPDAPAVSDSSLSEKWYLGVLVGVLIWVGVAPSGPKIAGVPLPIDPGVINVINTSMNDLATPYAPAAPK